MDPAPAGAAEAAQHMQPVHMLAGVQGLAPLAAGELHQQQQNGQAAGSRPKGRGNAEDASAAELLLGFGSADSEGGDSGGGSSSGHGPRPAGEEEATAALVAPAPTGGGRGGRGGRGSLRRSSRQARQPSAKAGDMLNQGAALSDDEFEPPATSKRPPKARAAAPAAAPAKSELTVLCERFQQQFGYLQPDGSPNVLMLNDVAEALGVPRRRLYDVINVFESIEVMRRVGKLMYEWVGFDHLPGLMEQLAAEEESGVPVEDRIRRAPTLVQSGEGGEEAVNPKGNSHSLWVLSRRLVRMLLKSTGPIALTAAAAVLVGPGGVADPAQHRSQTQITVERRLYDIGSILCSVGLIERIYLKKRQPAFEWIYGWKPGQSHDPPKLPNNYGPAPNLSDAPLPTRKRAARPGAGGAGAKRARGSAEAAADAAVAAAGALPFGMPFGMPLTMSGMPGMSFGMAGAGGMPSPASMMAAMGLPTMSPSADGKDGGAQMPMLFPSFFPGTFPGMASAATSPDAGIAVLPKVEGGGGSADGTAGGSSEGKGDSAMAAAGQAGLPQMMMWSMPGMGMPMMSMQMPGMQNHVLPMVATDGTVDGTVGSGGKGANGAQAPFQFTMMPTMLVPVPQQQQQQQQQQQDKDEDAEGDHDEEEEDGGEP